MGNSPARLSVLLTLLPLPKTWIARPPAEKETHTPSGSPLLGLVLLGLAWLRFCPAPEPRVQSLDTVFDSVSKFATDSCPSMDSQTRTFTCAHTIQSDLTESVTTEQMPDPAPPPPPPDTPEDIRRQEELHKWVKKLRPELITPYVARQLGIPMPIEIEPVVEPLPHESDEDPDADFVAAIERGEAPGQPDFAKPNFKSGAKQDPKKITVMLDHQLWLGLKHQGIAEERSGQKIMEQALMEYLAKHQEG
jgi:hypothetical protein